MLSLNPISEFRKAGPMRLPVQLASGRLAEFRLFFYQVEGEPFYVLVRGDPKERESVLVRLASACSFAHVFRSLRCDCREQLDDALSLIAGSGGILVYAWGQEGRGAGFENHVLAYMKQDEGLDTVEAYRYLGIPIDVRDYSRCAAILRDFGLKHVRLLTNNPQKIDGIEEAGLRVERVPLVAGLNKFNESQLRAKKEKLGHLYDLKQ